MPTIGTIQGGAFTDAGGNVLNGGSIAFTLSAPAQVTGGDSQVVSERYSNVHYVELFGQRC